jgi:hypothetical protein
LTLSSTAPLSTTSRIPMASAASKFDSSWS